MKNLAWYFGVLQFIRVNIGSPSSVLSWIWRVALPMQTWDRLKLQFNHSKGIHCIARRNFNFCYQILVLHHEKFCRWYSKLKLVQGCHREHQLSPDEPSQGKLWQVQCVLELEQCGMGQRRARSSYGHCPCLVRRLPTRNICLWYDCQVMMSDVHSIYNFSWKC